MLKKLSVTLLITVLFIFDVNAQVIPPPVFRGKSISFGPNGNYSLGSLTSSYRVGIGAYGQAEIPITSFNATASAGYVTFFHNQFVKNRFHSQGQQYKSYSYLPLKVGAKYYITYNFYANAEAGAVIGLNNGSKVGFAWSPGVGFALPVGSSHGVDIGLGYEGWQRADTPGEINMNNFISVKLAYKIGI